MSNSQTFKTTIEIELPGKKYLDLFEAIAKLKGIAVGQAIGEAMVADGDASVDELSEIWEERMENEKATNQVTER